MSHTLSLSLSTPQSRQILWDSVIYHHNYNQYANMNPWALRWKNFPIMHLSHMRTQHYYTLSIFKPIHKLKCILHSIIRQSVLLLYYLSTLSLRNNRMNIVYRKYICGIQNINISRRNTSQLTARTPVKAYYSIECRIWDLESITIQYFLLERA